MRLLKKAGGMAALTEAATFIIGFWVYFTLLEPASYGSMTIDADQHVRLLADRQVLMYTWNLIIYVLFGVVLVVLTLSLNERLKTGAPALSRVATAFGLIWAGLVIASGMVANIGTALVVELYDKGAAEAATVWYTLYFVVNGLGGGNEVVGGIWTLLVSCAAFNVAGIPRTLNILGLIVGGAGLLTTIPVFEMLGAVFGLGLIAWFLGVGVVLLRDNHENLS